MCYVKRGKDIISERDLQVLVSDTIYCQNSPFTYTVVKNHIVNIATEDGMCRLPNLRNSIEKILYDTLKQLILRKLVVPCGNRQLIYVE